MTMFAGIDVGATSVVLVCRQNGRSSGPETFAQSVAGHAALVRRLCKVAPQCVVLEATGIYYLDLALALQAAGLPVAVINPRSFHHFAKLKLVGSKTDGVDAALLAEYAERMNPPLWQAPDPHRLALRDVGRQINRLTAARTQAKNRLHALRARASTLPLLIDDELEEQPKPDNAPHDENADLQLQPDDAAGRRIADEGVGPDDDPHDAVPPRGA